MILAIVGVTGMVGEVMLNILEERQFPITDLIPVASESSSGKEVVFLGKTYKIITLEKLLLRNVNLAFFSAGGEVSKHWAPKLAEKGCKVIDNSSYWRMSPRHKLIIPEINGCKLEDTDAIIANPNCSTIQLLMVLAPLHYSFLIQRVVVSTYQSVTGTGRIAVNQLENEEHNIGGETAAYPHPIYRNALPHCDDFEKNGYTKEEMKLTRETKKILDPEINVSATAVRIPVVGGHSESVNITFKKDPKLEDILSVLKKMKGVEVADNVFNNEYPMPITSEGKDEVFVGRIRKDFSFPRSFNMWITTDNLRKGAATNAVQIAELLKAKNFI